MCRFSYIFEHPSTRASYKNPESFMADGSSPMDPVFANVGFSCDSPGAQTLASVKREDNSDNSTTSTNNRMTAKNLAPEEGSHIHAKSWKNNTFGAWNGLKLSRWNPYKFCLQICRGNVSIYAKGTCEIFR